MANPNEIYVPGKRIPISEFTPDFQVNMARASQGLTPETQNAEPRVNENQIVVDKAEYERLLDVQKIQAYNNTLPPLPGSTFPNNNTPMNNNNVPSQPNVQMNEPVNNTPAQTNDNNNPNDILSFLGMNDENPNGNPDGNQNDNPNNQQPIQVVEHQENQNNQNNNVPNNQTNNNFDLNNQLTTFNNELDRKGMAAGLPPGFMPKFISTISQEDLIILAQAKIKSMNSNNIPGNNAAPNTAPTPTHTPAPANNNFPISITDIKAPVPQNTSIITGGGVDPNSFKF